MCLDKQLLVSVCSTFEKEYFETTVAGDIYVFLKDYIEKYDSLPSRDIIVNSVKESGDYFKEVDSIDVDIIKDYDYVFDQTNFYLKDRALKTAILESVEVINKGDSANNGSIQKLIEDAIIKDLKIDLGLNYFQTNKERLKRILSNTTKRVPTYFPALDEYLSGGFPPYTLSVFIARIHGGKCLFYDTMIKIKNPDTGTIEDIAIGDFFNKISNSSKCNITHGQEAEKNMSNVKNYINKYGEVEGQRRYDVAIEKMKESLKRTTTGVKKIDLFIKKYGDVDGQRRYDEYIISLKNGTKGINSLEHCKKLYGDVDGQRRYDIKSKRISDPGRCTFDYFQKRYGDVEGARRREQYLQKQSKSQSLDGYIEKYGKLDGTIKYLEHSSILSHVQTLNGFIERYGQKEGLVRYELKKNRWIKTMNDKSDEEKARILKSKVSKSISNQSNRVFECIEKCFNITIKREEIVTPFVVDGLYNNIIIEYYGDYWHCNPTMFDENYYHRKKRISAKELWLYDKLRVEYLKELGYSVFIIWEQDWKRKSEEIINDFAKLI